MSDPDKKSPLNDISHLFLSSLRENQQAGSSRPVRKPPPKAPPDRTFKPDVSIDLTPEEFAGVLGDAHDESGAPLPPTTAIIGSHLNGHLPARVREYASHLASNGQRIGILDLSATDLRITIVEKGAHELTDAPQIQPTDQPKVIEALEELSWDIDRWLIVLSNLRSPESRMLLRAAGGVTLFATSDHDGVVSGYRALKGVVEVVDGVDAPLPKRALCVAIFGAPSQQHGSRVASKLAGVCQQFLNWNVENEVTVQPSRQTTEHMVAHFKSMQAPVQGALPTHFVALHELLTRRASTNDNSDLRSLTGGPVETHSQPTSHFAEPVSRSSARKRPQDADMPAAAHRQNTPPPAPVLVADPAEPEVIELTGSPAQPGDIVRSVVRARGDKIECPIKPPMCPDAIVAVSRDRRLLLVAVSQSGLKDLRSIGLAYRWLNESRQLVAMALPQLSIDPHHAPHLELLVDAADVSADIVQPLLHSTHVTVVTYRRLRWSGRTGLLLEAA
jgi:hypothetical protein